MLQQPSSVLPTNTASSQSDSPPPTPVVPLPQHVEITSPIPPFNRKAAICDFAADCVSYCKAHNINDSTEILQYAQKCIVTGKPLNGYTDNEDSGL